MRAFVLQDWVTIRGNTGITPVVQNEAAYLALDAYQDVIFWLQVTEVTVGGGTITMNYETAPLKDETLFVAMATVGLSTASLTPTVTKVLAAAATNPLSRWVRWRLTTSGTTAPWDVTFRIMVSGNQLFATGR
jgi:hypothetical protein